MFCGDGEVEVVEVGLDVALWGVLCLVGCAVVYAEEFFVNGVADFVYGGLEADGKDGGGHGASLCGASLGGGW